MTIITTSTTTTEGFVNRIYTFDKPVNLDAIKSIIRQQVENQRLKRPHIACGLYTNPPANPYKHCLPSPPTESVGEKAVKRIGDLMVEPQDKKESDAFQMLNETEIQDKIKALEEEKHALFQHLKTLLSSQGSQKKSSIEPALESKQDPKSPGSHVRSSSRDSVNSRKSRSRSVSHPDYRFTASRYTPYKSNHRQDFFDRTRNYDRRPYHLPHIPTLPDTQLLTHHALLTMPYLVCGYLSSNPSCSSFFHKSRRMSSYSTSRPLESVRLPFRSSRGFDRHTSRY
ncbi:hypothetical protein CLU79DRAFT_347861 [Phycomyces nitens]|nr:hypothetical protein CLU79DRAFT_347861 [Phycomyces nitens]